MNQCAFKIYFIFNKITKFAYYYWLAPHYGLFATLFADKNVNIQTQLSRHIIIYPMEMTTNDQTTENNKHMKCWIKKKESNCYLELGSMNCLWWSETWATIITLRLCYKTFDFIVLSLIISINLGFYRFPGTNKMKIHCVTVTGAISKKRKFQAREYQQRNISSIDGMSS